MTVEHSQPIAVGGLPGGRSSVPAQRAFTIVTRVQPARLHDLSEYLAEIGNDIRRNPHVDFSRYDRLHYCAFIVVVDPQEDPLLVFEGNIDGPIDAFLHDLAQRDQDFLVTAYSCCEEFPDNAPPSEIVRYLLGRDRGHGALYVGQPGATVVQIRRDLELRDKIEAELDRFLAQRRSESPEGWRALIREFVDGRDELRWARTAVPRPARVRWGRLWLAGLVGGGVLASAALVVLALVVGSPPVQWAVASVVIAVPLMIAAWLYRLRRHEQRDRQDDTIPDADLILRLRSREDRQLQNHLTSVTLVKAGWLRLLTLRAVLLVINTLARWIATRGDLSNIVTIHFARWLIIDSRRKGRKRLLFLSNYDGSWENYLGEFIDQASRGLTAVWSNTELDADRGFPDTRWLFRSGGSRDEQRFKNYARQSQHTEGIWYSAYPSISMKHITNNRQLREGLYGHATDLEAWLRCL